MVCVNYGISPVVLDMLLSDVSPCGTGCSSRTGARKQPRRLISVDVTEKESEFEIVADVPGVAKEAIHLDIDKDTLTLSISEPKASVPSTDAEAPRATDAEAPRATDAEAPRATDGDTPADSGRAEASAGSVEQPEATGAASQPKVLRRERIGRFSGRSLKLPETADLGQARAECVAGVLTVTVPKRALPSPHRIPIA